MLQSKGQTIDKVLNFAVPDQLLVERITGRWVHPASGRSYHGGCSHGSRGGAAELLAEEELGARRLAAHQAPLRAWRPPQRSMRRPRWRAWTT